MTWLYVLIVIFVMLSNFKVMKTRSQSLIYTHDYPLLDTELKSLEASTNVGIGVYLYVIDQSDQTPQSLDQLKKYLTVSFVDGAGDTLGAV